MKKICLMLMMWIFFSTNCFAMTFSQPVKIGEVSLTPMGLFEVNGYSYHNGTPSKARGFEECYEKGLAKFGDGKDALYFHYDANKKVAIPNTEYFDVLSRFGSQDAKNAVQVSVGIPTTIWLIKTDSEMTFYMLGYGEASTSKGNYHTLIGKRKDGTFVKYFDTYEIKGRYFNRKVPLPSRDSVLTDERGKYFFDRDTIILRYGKDSGYNQFNAIGELRFKWDDAAQWFGVEHVVY